MNNLKAIDMNLLLHSRLFQGLSQDEILKLLPCLDSRRQDFHKNEWLLRAGEPITEVGLLLNGSAQIVREDYWGRRHIVSTLVPGDLFGLSYAAIKVQQARIGVKATEKAGALFLNLQNICSTCTTCSNTCTYHGKLTANIIGILVSFNVKLHEKLRHITQPTIRDKVLSYLSSQAQIQHSTYIEIPFNRQELADYLNVDRSALSNELSKMKKDGLIDYQKNHFKISPHLKR